MINNKALGSDKGPGTFGPLLLLTGLLGLCVFLAFALAKTSSLIVLGGALGFLMLATSFLRPEWGLAILVVSMLLSPEIGAGAAGSGGSVEGGRSVVIRLDDLLLVILSAAWFARTAVYKNLGLARKSRLNKPLGLYVFSCFISTALGILAGNVHAKLGTFFVLRYIEYFIVFFVGINFINSEQSMRRFMKIAFATAIAVAIYGMSQIPLGIRVSAPFEGDQGEPNTMGGYLLLMMCMATGQLMFARRLSTRLYWGGFLLLMFVPLLFTGSRASWLGIPFALMAFFWFSHRKKQILIFTICMLASANVLLPKSVKERILFTFEQQKQLKAKQLVVGGVRLDTSTTARLESYKVSYEGWRKRPILGFGVTGYVFIDSQYFRTLVETGLLGMFALLWLYWAYFQAGRAAMRASPNGFQRGIAIGYLAGLFGLLAHSTGSNTFIILRIMEPWMLFTAMVVKIPELAVDREKRWEELVAEAKEASGEDLSAELNTAVQKNPEPQTPAEAAEAAADRQEAEGERFEKKLSEFEEFLEREKIEEARRAIESRFEASRQLPRFRRMQTKTGPGGVSFRPRESKPEETGAEPSQAGTAEPSPERAPRTIDLIRGRRSMMRPMRRK